MVIRGAFLAFPKHDTEQGERERWEKQQTVENHAGGDESADTVRISDYRRIPDAAIIVGIVGSLDNQFRLTIQEKGTGGILNEGGIVFHRYVTRATQAVAVYKDFCSAERLLEIERYIAAAPKMQTPGSSSVRISVCMK